MRKKGRVFNINSLNDHHICWCFSKIKLEYFNTFLVHHPWFLNKFMYNNKKIEFALSTHTIQHLTKKTFQQPQTFPIPVSRNFRLVSLPDSCFLSRNQTDLCKKLHPIEFLDSQIRDFQPERKSGSRSRTPVPLDVRLFKWSIVRIVSKLAYKLFRGRIQPTFL